MEWSYWTYFENELTVYEALLKRIQHFTEQRTTFVLAEIVDSFNHLLYYARCCSMLLCVEMKCSIALPTFLIAIKNISPITSVVRCSEKCWIRLTRAFVALLCFRDLESLPWNEVTEHILNEVTEHILRMNWMYMRPCSSESNISPSSIQHSCLLK